MTDNAKLIAEANRIAADFSTIPFKDHEARTLALAYFALKDECERLEKALRYYTFTDNPKVAYEALEQP